MPDYLFSVNDRFDGGTYYRALVNDEEEIHRLEQRCEVAGFAPEVTRLDPVSAIDRFLDQYPEAKA